MKTKWFNYLLAIASLSLAQDITAQDNNTRLLTAQKVNRINGSNLQIIDTTIPALKAQKHNYVASLYSSNQTVVEINEKDSVPPANGNMKMRPLIGIDTNKIKADNSAIKPKEN